MRFFMYLVYSCCCVMIPANNAFTGPVPSELGELNVLKVIKLDENTLTGPIPTQIGNIGGLVSLGLGK